MQQTTGPVEGSTTSASLPDMRGITQQFFADHPELPPELETVLVDRIEARVPEAAARTLTKIREQIPAYQQIDGEETAQSIGTLLASVVAHARVASEPSRDLLDPFESLATRRTFDGIPLDALLQAVHIGSREIIAIVDEEFIAADIPVEGILQMRDLAWEWAHGISNTIARMHSQLEEQRRRRERGRRGEFVRTLLLGTHRLERLRPNSMRFGLALDRPYIPFCSRPRSRRDALDIASTILRTGADGDLSPVVETMDGDIVGLSPLRPHVSDHLVAIGEPMLLDQVHQSFTDACSALDAAHAFGMTGTVTLEDLGPRPLIVASERVAVRLDRSVLTAFPEGPEPHEIERTVLEHLGNDQDAEVTARQLCVHVNTVRYRLGRFRELTGLDLRRTEDLVAAWWLLNRRAAARRDDESAGVVSGLAAPAERSSRS